MERPWGLRAHPAGKKGKPSEAAVVEAPVVEEGNIKMHGPASGSSSVANRRRVVGIKRSCVGLNARSVGLKGVLSSADVVERDEEYMSIGSSASKGAIHPLKQFLDDGGSFPTVIYVCVPDAKKAVSFYKSEFGAKEYYFDALRYLPDLIDFPFTAELDIQGTAFFIWENPDM